MGQLSTDGGRSPLWSANGRELFYRSGNRMMVVAAETSPAFRAGIAQLLFDGDFVPESDVAGVNNHDVSADGKRFLVLRPVGGDTGDEAARPRINIVLNWFEELKRLVPDEVTRPRRSTAATVEHAEVGESS